MPRGVTLLIGGARSGKSSLAVEIGRVFHAAGGAVTVAATATASDADMEQRISRHRRDRPDWSTVEEPIELAEALESVPSDHLVIVDCLTMWVSNLMFAERSEEEVLTAAVTASSAAARRSEPVVVITNEVGLGVHPPTELGLRYRDLLGRVNQTWAASADRSLFLVAGRAVVLSDPWIHLR